jgi:predicted N-acetyltransferase YhbS
LPFEAPRENRMVIELTKEGLKELSGTVEYPKEFYV